MTVNTLIRVNKLPHLKAHQAESKQSLSGAQSGKVLLVWSYSSSALWQQCYKRSCLIHSLPDNWLAKVSP